MSSDIRNKYIQFPSDSMSADIDPSSLEMVLDVVKRKNYKGTICDAEACSVLVHGDWMMMHLEGLDEATEPLNEIIIQEDRESERKGPNIDEPPYTKGSGTM
ncbi:hypothetical protein RSAG8_11293, partial [Rhizoctonia solani AG-8 WAC10335]